MRGEPPVSAPQPPAPRRLPSLILVNTGDGKGKSTAAFGTALRAVARGWKVCVIQFLKSGQWKVGEEDVGLRLGMDWWSIGDGFTWNSTDMGSTEAIARSAWAAAVQRIEAGEHDMVVLDEITYPINWGWIDLVEVVSVLRERPDGVNVILTGRDAPDALIEVADTATEMVKLKHAYDTGVRARRGIDL